MNDGAEEAEATAAFIRSLSPDTAYILVPTRPPAEGSVQKPEKKTIRAVYDTFLRNGLYSECMTENETDTFFFTDDVEGDILSISSVHPLRKDVWTACSKRRAGRRRLKKSCWGRTDSGRAVWRRDQLQAESCGGPIINKKSSGRAPDHGIGGRRWPTRKVAANRQTAGKQIFRSGRGPAGNRTDKPAEAGGTGGDSSSRTSKGSIRTPVRSECRFRGRRSRAFCRPQRASSPTLCQRQGGRHRGREFHPQHLPDALRGLRPHLGRERRTGHGRRGKIRLPQMRVGADRLRRSAERLRLPRQLPEARMARRGPPRRRRRLLAGKPERCRMVAVRPTQNRPDRKQEETIKKEVPHGVRFPTGGAVFLTNVQTN